MFELIIFLILGIIAGTFTGLAPGIHINLIASILVSLVSKMSIVNPIQAVVFIVAMSITHTFTDFIPSIYLGAPEEGNFLSILPGHEMFLEGKAHEAVVYTLYGSLSAIFAVIIFTPILLIYSESFYEIIKSIVPFILIFISCYIILRDDKVFTAFLIFFLSGILGLLVFNNPVREPLLPLLTGLFGISNLIVSLQSKEKFINQKTPKIKEILLTKKEFIKSFAASSIISPFLSFLPGISSSHVATIASEIVPQERKGFLFMMGSINTIIMALTFFTVFTIGKTRSGSAAAIKELLPVQTSLDLTIILFSIVLSGLIAFFLGIKISSYFANFIGKINYRKISISVIIILILVNIIFTNMLGIIVLMTASTLGVFVINSDAKRINLMGSLIIPVIIYYIV